MRAMRGVRLSRALSGVDNRIGQLGGYELYAEHHPELQTEAPQPAREFNGDPM